MEASPREGTFDQSGQPPILLLARAPFERQTLWGPKTPGSRESRPTARYFQAQNQELVDNVCG